MSYKCLLMVLCECACVNLISKINFNLLDRTALFIRMHIMFQISFQSSKGQKSYRKFLGVLSELLLSILLFVLSRVTWGNMDRLRTLSHFSCHIFLSPLS